MRSLGWEGEADSRGCQSTRPLEDSHEGQEPSLDLQRSGAWYWLLREGLQDILRITKSRKNWWAFGELPFKTFPLGFLLGNILISVISLSVVGPSLGIHRMRVDIRLVLFFFFNFPFFFL